MLFYAHFYDETLAQKNDIKRKVSIFFLGAGYIVVRAILARARYIVSEISKDREALG